MQLVKVDTKRAGSTGARLPFLTAAISAVVAVTGTGFVSLTVALAASGVFIASVLVIAVRALRDDPRPAEARARLLPDHTDPRE